MATPSTSAAAARKIQWPPIGLGCVTFGREIDLTAAFAMMDFARENGINFFDTAAVYAGGASERAIGEWFAARRPPARSVVVATKLLPPYSPMAIADGVAASASRLSPAPVDLLYLHKWDETAAHPDTLRALDRLVQAGRAGALGISNVNAEQLARLVQLQRELGLQPFSAVQNNNNLALREVDAALRDVCRRHGIAIVTYSPLGAGFLTGKYRASVPPGTRFDVIPGHQRLYFQPTARARLARLEEVATRTGMAQSQLALGWALHQPDIATILVGGRSPAHLQQAIVARALDHAALWRELEA